MFRAMALKELRELRGIMLLALAAYGVVLWNEAIGLKAVAQRMPFVDDGFIKGYIVVSGALAIALGLRQTIGESLAGTYLFLFHRPATRRWLIGAKLVLGLLAYLSCAMVPIAIYAIIAATPGVHASPFFWSMTIPTLFAWLAITPVYFGAVLSGIRPGNWFYSRLFPLAGSGLAAALTAILYMELGYGTVVSLTPAVLINAWLATLILFVARNRDYP